MKTYLTPDMVTKFTSRVSNDRLLEIVQGVKATTNIELPNKRLSYVEIFNIILKQGSLCFLFDPDRDPDHDDEIIGNIRFIANNGEEVVFSCRYVHSCVMNLPVKQLSTKQPNDEESTKMKKVFDSSKAVAGGVVSANMSAFGEAAKLQAGRASNKAVKEAVRPLVKMMFKPSFMQRLVSRLFKTENPIDKFLDSPYGSLFAAQVSQAVVSMRGVENEKVKSVVKGGMVYAYNELGDLIPLESAIDTVINKLTDSAEKIVK